jgi:hypothetical protein
VFGMGTGVALPLWPPNSTYKLDMEKVMYRCAAYWIKRPVYSTYTRLHMPELQHRLSILPRKTTFRVHKNGLAGTRTQGLCLAKAAIFQLIYKPERDERSIKDLRFEDLIGFNRTDKSSSDRKELLAPLKDERDFCNSTHTTTLCEGQIEGISCI